MTTPSYPGVYLQEVPSGSRAITGVATSICAFVGRTLRGPTDRTVMVNNFTEFDRMYGGLWKDSPLSYAVQQFFINGGTQAVIARVVNGGSKSTTSAPMPPLRFRATTAGAASNGIQIELAASAGAKEFSIRVRATDTTVLMAVQTVSYDPEAANFVGTVLALQGAPVEVLAPVPQADPTPGTLTLADGADAAGDDPAVAATVKQDLVAITATFEATSVGTWGDNLRLTINHDTHPAGDPDLFNVLISEVDAKGTVIRTESHLNLNATSGEKRYAKDVINENSRLVDLSTFTDVRPAAVANQTFGGGDEGAAVTATQVDAALAAENILDKTDLFNLLVIPDFAPGSEVQKATHTKAVSLCESKNALYLASSPADWKDGPAATAGLTGYIDRNKNAALFFPQLNLPDPLRENRPRAFGAAASIAGLIARTDSQRGFWKAPAGLEANLRGVSGLTVTLTDLQQGALNQQGISAIRTFPVVGTVNWGARTLDGADLLASEWKYIPVRRVALNIKESLYRGTQWAVFEPNDERLWSQLRLSIGSFMNQLFRRGAFFGSNPREAYFVKCDAETTTPDDIALGVVNIIVGFKPVLPAEFVIIKLQQIAGESAA